MFYLMDVVYAAGYNVTKKICMGLGQQEEEKKKFCSFDEVVTLVNKAIATPECSGTYHDYVELCKLYDKNENGTMMLAELENILSNLGEKFGVKICKYPVFRKLSLLAYNQIIIDNQMVPF